MYSLRKHQVPHFQKLWAALNAHGFCHDGSMTGTGKTHCAAACAAALGQEVLVVCPLSVVPAWEDTLAGYGVTNATVINYQKAWRRLGQLHPWGKGSFFKWDKQYPLTIYDEVHRACGDSTINAKMLIASKRAGGKVLTLSATVADTPLRMKAWGYTMGLHKLTDWQTFLLKCNCKPGVFGGWTFNRTTNSLIVQGLHEQIYLPQDGLPAKGARLRKQDIPGFPKTQLNVRTLPCADKSVLRLSKELQELYAERVVEANESKKEALRRVAQAEDAILRGALPETFDPEQCGRGYKMTEILRLRQALEVAKLPDIEDMIEDKIEDSKVVVFCNFNATIDELLKVAEKRKWTVGTIRGEQSASASGLKLRRETELAFQRNELDLMLVNIEAGGVALSFHDPVTQFPRSTIICPTFSASSLVQVLGRVVRDGGGFSEQYLLYFAEGIEAVVAKTVQRKIEALDTLNDGELSGESFFRKGA